MATYSLRKRQRAGDSSSQSNNPNLTALSGCSSFVVFSGSGVSASTGMSMFSTKGGLYERAKKQLKVQDGAKLFSYKYYNEHKQQAQAFYADIFTEATRAAPASSHAAIREMHKQGWLQRHYTLNIDGLSEMVGLDTWHPERLPAGSTVELHGNIRYLVCPGCSGTRSVAEADIAALKKLRPLPCTRCRGQELRFKVMLYDDDEGHAITPDTVFEQLEQDLRQADAVIWAGISFEQSASTAYFRRVWQALAAQDRSEVVKQVIINPDDEASFNLLSSCNDIPDLEAHLVDVRATADEALVMLEAQLKCGLKAAMRDGKPVRQ